MDYGDALIPLFAFFFVFGAPCAVWLVSRVLAHHERMEMLRTRHRAAAKRARHAARDESMAGRRAMTPQGMSNQYLDYPDFYAQHQLRRGVQVAFIGLALLIGLGFIGYHGDGTFVYGPWLLGGLIPLFVGIAQIIGAVLGGASFGPAAARQQFRPSPWIESTLGSWERSGEWDAARARLRRLAPGTDTGDRKTRLAAGLSKLSGYRTSTKAMPPVGWPAASCYRIKTILLAGDQGHGPAGGRASPDQISVRSPIVNLIARSECVG